MQISQIAQLPDDTAETIVPPKPFNDDPLDKQADLMDKYLNKAAVVFGRGPALFAPGEMGDAATMTRSVNIAAETFEELQAILAKFNDTTKQLPAVPDSLLTAHNPAMTPMR